MSCYPTPNPAGTTLTFYSPADAAQAQRIISDLTLFTSGKALASMPQADVIADCGRLGADGPLYDLLAEATTVVLVTKVHVADVIRLRDRATAFAAAAQSRGRRNFGVGVVVVADHKKFRASLGVTMGCVTVSVLTSETLAPPN